MDKKIALGLNDQEVQERVLKNEVNTHIETISKTFPEIIKGNVYTLFNFVNIVLAIFIFMTGHFQNMLFMGVVIGNLLIGIIQEIRAKLIIDKMSLIIESRVNVVRNGKIISISIHEIVKNDVLLVSTGQQIVCDCIVVENEIEVNESLISGESDSVLKTTGDKIYSGSFVVSNEAYVEVINVANENYATQIMKQAKQFKKYRSTLYIHITKIIKFSSIFIFPFGAFMALKNLYVYDLSLVDTILTTAAAMIGMIPEGLVILVSMALSIGSIHLARKRVLVQELYCLDMLARVDVLCLDKTGTITNGTMQVESVICQDKTLVNDIMYTIIQLSKNKNTTMLALQEHFTNGNFMKDCQFTPFSSERKYTAIHKGSTSYYVGAHTFISTALSKAELQKIAKATSVGHRVLSVIMKQGHQESLVAIISIQEEIRESAKQTIAYFKQQGVHLKIISGDDPLSVKEIAKRVGIVNYDAYIDLSTCQQSIDEIANQYTVFGRVNPEQKKQLIHSIKKAGHCVGMSGDGVNDVLAFKEADVSIAMASGSDMARKSANIILLDNHFDALPYVLYEGRKVINNVQRVATLFLTKTILSFLLVFFTMTTSYIYPFEPIHLTFMSTLTIGIPGFLFALEASKARVDHHFLKNVIEISFPAGASVVCALLYLFILQSNHSISFHVYQQLCLLIISINGMLVLGYVNQPFSIWRSVVIVVMGIGMVIGFICGSTYLGLGNVHFASLIQPLILVVLILMGAYLVIAKLTKVIYPMLWKKKI